MKKIIFLIGIISSVWGCKKTENEVTGFQKGTFQGEKTVYYFSTHTSSVDTITIYFQDTTYTYSGFNSTSSLDYGRGNYIVKNDSIELNDQEVRVALYSWSWILAGKFKYEFMNDSVMILNKMDPDRQISCRLHRIFAEN